MVSSVPVVSEASKLGRSVKLMYKVLKKRTIGGKNSRQMITYGKQKKDGSHDLRGNRGGDRTPAQKAGDKKRRK